jgi:hypothetical protein
LTGLNGTYVLEPGSWVSAPVCGGRYIEIGNLTLGTAQNCAGAGEVNFSDGVGTFTYSLEITRANNGTEIVKLLVGVGASGTITGASAIVWATINTNEACCETTPVGFAKFTVMTITSSILGSVDGKLCNPFFVSATRTFSTSTTECERSFITQDNSDLITQAGDSRIPQQ